MKPLKPKIGPLAPLEDSGGPDGRRLPIYGPCNTRNTRYKSFSD